MTSRLRFLLPLLLTVSLATACKKEDPVAALEKSAADLEKTPAAPAEGDAPVGPAPAEQVKQAVADFKAGKMEDAVTPAVAARPAGDDPGSAHGPAGQHRLGDAGNLRDGLERRRPRQGCRRPVRTPADRPLIGPVTRPVSVR